MSAEFWLGVVITLIVGIPGAYLIGIFANIHARKFDQFLERRKLLKWHKTKLQALMVFNRVKAFREGRRDKYPYYMILASASVSCAVVASTVIMVALFSVNFTFEFRMWPAPDLDDTQLGESSLSLELHRAQIPDRRVPSL
jgi:hypothetical protein